jgi:GNAT superfamily N-acetyltransferase
LHRVARRLPAAHLKRRWPRPQRERIRSSSGLSRRRTIHFLFCRHQFDAQTAHYTANYPGASFQLIERSGKPAGRLYLARWENEIRIVDITLLPEHRGAGIGAKLLRDLQEEAKGVGKKLSIHVERMNPALQLYERLGFQQVEDKGVYLLLHWSSKE